MRKNGRFIKILFIDKGKKRMEKVRKYIKYYTINYNKISLDVVETEYVGGKRIALQAIEHDSGLPYAVLTTNVPAYDRDYSDKRMIILDCNNCPDIDKALKKAGLIGECIGKVQSGWCTYPVHKYLG